jgi:carbon-monoxide dehydrogenase medium subunit
MKLRMSSPRYVVDMNRIEGMSGIRDQGGVMTFGALTCHADVEESAAVKAKLPIMHDTACVIGDVQIRNRGTIGGSMAHADPGGDWPPTLLALGAKVKCRGPKGERIVAVDDLLQDAYVTSIGGNEVLTEVQVPLPPAGSGGAYIKFERKAGDFAVASVAVQVTLKSDGTCNEIGIGLGAVGLRAIKAAKAEALLRGRKATDDLIRQAATSVSAESDPFADTRGPEDYKRHLVGVLFVRAMSIALRRARGEAVETAHV